MGTVPLSKDNRGRAGLVG